MSESKIFLEGLGILLFGWICILWQIALILSCILVSIFISGKLGVNGYSWWATTIVSFAFLIRLLSFGSNYKKNYSDLVENYNEKYNSEYEYGDIEENKQ